MYDDFKCYLRQHKRNFREYQFETDKMYRCICIGQYGVPYKNSKDRFKPNDFKEMMKEKQAFDSRVKNRHK